MRVLGLKARKLAGIPPKHKLRVLPRTTIQHEVTKVEEDKVQAEAPVEEPEKLATPKKPRTKKPKVVEEVPVEIVEPENNKEKPEE